jgi:hypothetical protein
MRTLLHALREDVLPRVADGEARERLRAAVAVLRGLSRTRAREDEEALREAVARLAAQAGGEDAAAAGDPGEALARLARELMRRPGIAGDPDDPLHRRLRATVAVAASPALGRWP